MEETLGKRICAKRKGLGLTQDALAEQLGVTAQAVSKWENDQSCPDITMLPKLAEVFGISTDALLGLEPKEVRQAEVIREENDDQEPGGFHVQNGTWELQWDGGRKSGIGFALWILLVGGLLFAANFFGWNTDFFDLLWSSGLMIFGLLGLYPRFSIFRLGCALFGGYFLYNEITVTSLSTKYLLPAFLLLFGLSLLVDALRKPKKGAFHVHHNGKHVGGKHGKFTSECSLDGESFDCSTTFGEDHRLISLPRLSSGDMSIAFGNLTVDLSGCDEIAPGCALDASCSFGELIILVPRKWRVEPNTSTAFGAVEITGSPAPDADAVIHLECSASFGQITVRYI